MLLRYLVLRQQEQYGQLCIVLVVGNTWVADQVLVAYLLLNTM